MPMFQVGDKVKIAPNGLAQHSKSVPAHMGYTSDQFKWRKTISDLQDAGKVGRVTRVSGDNVDCDFGGANEIVLYDYLLVKESSRATAILDKILLKHINESEPLPIGDGWYIMRTGMDANGNYCAWVARGDNAARKIQTNGNAPTAHHKNPNEIVKSDKAMAELRDYANKYFDTDESKTNEGLSVLISNAQYDKSLPWSINTQAEMKKIEKKEFLGGRRYFPKDSHELQILKQVYGDVQLGDVTIPESNDDDVEAKKKDLADWTAKAKAELDKKKDDAPKPKDEELSVPDRHQLAIAKKTLQMSDAGARIMGGMTKEEARAIIKKLTGKDAKEEPEDECMESDQEDPCASEFGAGCDYPPKDKDEDTHPAIVAYNKVRDRETDDEKRASAWGEKDKPTNKKEELDAAEMQPYDQLTRSDNEPNDKDGEDMDRPGMNKLDPKQLGENDIRPLAIGTRVKIQYGIGSNPQDDMLTGRIVDSGTKGENRKVKVKTDSGEQINILSTAVTPTSEAIASYDIVPGDKKNWSVRKDGVEVHTCDKEDEAKKHVRKLQGFKESRASKILAKITNEAKGGLGTDVRYNVGDKVKVIFNKRGWQNGTIVNIQGPKYDTVMYDIKMDDGKLQKSIAQYHMDNADESKANEAGDTIEYKDCVIFCNREPGSKLQFTARTPKGDQVSADTLDGIKKLIDDKVNSNEMFRVIRAGQDMKTPTLQVGDKVNANTFRRGRVTVTVLDVNKDTGKVEIELPDGYREEIPQVDCSESEDSVTWTVKQVDANGKEIVSDSFGDESVANAYAARQTKMHPDWKITCIKEDVDMGQYSAAGDKGTSSKEYYRKAIADAEYKINKFKNNNRPNPATNSELERMQKQLDMYRKWYDAAEKRNEESPDDLVVLYKGAGDTSWHIQYNPMGTHSSETANRTADALIKQYGQNNVKIMKRHEAENSGLMEDYQANVKRFPKGTKVKFNSHCSNPDLVGKEGTVEMVMSGQPDKTQIAVRLPSRDGVFTHADSLDIVESLTNEDLDSSCNKIWHLAKEIVQEVDDLTDYIHGSEFNKSESRASKILKRFKEDMHLTQLGPNQTEIRVGGKYVLFSYQTPVAYSDESGNCFRTATNYSTTTSKHINAWLGGRQAKSVPQEQISKAAGQ
jgi:hypothetical protein